MICCLIGVALFIFMLEQLVPGWRLPKVSIWVARAVFLNIVQVSIALPAGITWNKRMMEHSLLHTSDALPPLLVGFAAYFISTFITYWGCHAYHANDTLGRLLHQLHHAPQRIKVFTSFCKHLIEMVFNSLLGSFVAYVMMGISIEAGAYYIMFATLGKMFYHLDLRTSHVLDYLFQRPEIRHIHHQRDRHECNCSDFPIWDVLFGAYENPHRIDEPQGFTGNEGQRFVDMLPFHDVRSFPGRTQPAPVLVKPDVGGTSGFQTSIPVLAGTYGNPSRVASSSPRWSPTIPMHN